MGIVFKINIGFKITKKNTQNYKTSAYSNKEQTNLSWTWSLRVPCIYILESVCFIHQNLNSFKTNSDYHKYDTRTSCNIHLNYHRLTRSLNSISHQGWTLYNKLPHYIKEYNNRLFKKEVKKSYLNICHSQFKII